uniref:Endonuclease/exonuclease/phosphatase domain-containing protein n=1 Tax=Latimeria chalumnae TaxID=7897 RepID=H3B6N9_LATCH
GQFVIVSGWLNNCKFTLAAVYTPNIDDPQMLRGFLLQLAPFPMPWVVGGETNCTLDPIMDRLSSVSADLTKSARTILEGLEDFALVDVRRHGHPTSKEYSFHLQVHNMFSRINPLLHRVEACSYHPRSILDHSSLDLIMDFPEIRPPSRRWRLNPRLLIREESRAMIRNRIEEYMEVNTPDSATPEIIWEALKATLRGHIISYSVAHRKKAQAQVLELELDLRWAETEEYKNHSAETSERVAKIRHELNMLTTSKAGYALLRTKSRYYARGDKAGKLLAWQLRKEEAERKIQESSISESTTSKEPEVITSYYSTLYTSEKGSRDQMSSFLDGIEIPTLGEGVKLLLERPITEEEVIAAIKGLPLRTSPSVE